MNVPENAHYIYAVLNHLSNMSKLLMAKCFWLVEAQEKKGENKRQTMRQRKPIAQGNFSWNLSREKKREIQNSIICTKTNLQPKSNCVVASKVSILHFEFFNCKVNTR